MQCHCISTACPSGRRALDATFLDCLPEGTFGVFVDWHKLNELLECLVCHFERSREMLMGTLFLAWTSTELVLSVVERLGLTARMYSISFRNDRIDISIANCLLLIDHCALKLFPRHYDHLIDVIER